MNPSCRIHRAATFFVALVALVSTGCGDPASVDGLAIDPLAQGPFGVGYRRLEVTYDPPDGSPPRTIPVNVWYPAPADIERRIADFPHPWYLYLESNYAFENAPAEPPAYDGGYPVLVHSHGHFGFGSQSYPLFEAMASYGFVVVSPEHVGDTLLDLDDPEYLASHYERAFDVSAALDLLENLPTDDPLEGECNTERAIISGHSRGTFTVWAVLGATLDPTFVADECAAGTFDGTGGCSAAQLAVYDGSFRDPRFVAGIPMAGSGDMDWFGGTAGMNTVSSPILQMSGSLDPVGADVIFAEVLNPPMTWIDYLGGCHNMFGSYRSCPEVNVDPDDAVRTIRTYTYAFARSRLFADDDPVVAGILDGSVSVSTAVTLMTR